MRRTPRQRMLDRIVLAVVRGAGDVWSRAARGEWRPDEDVDGELAWALAELWPRMEAAIAYLLPEERLRVLPAFRVAAMAHRGQRRKSGEPFFVHPVAVAELLASMRVQVEVVIAGLLHDTVEDNEEIGFHDLEALFGRCVRSIVEGETKASKRTKLMRSDECWSISYFPFYRFIFGDRRRGAEAVQENAVAALSKARQQAENLRDMFLAMSDDSRIILVKLADRLHNMRTLQHMTPKKRFAIAAETLVVFIPLAHRLGLWSFKTELEDLSFKYLHPQEFANLDKLLAMRRARYSMTLSSAARDLKLLLGQNSTMKGVHVSVNGREKGMYSLWYKLHRSEKYLNNIDNVADVIALRVVLDLDRLPGESDEQYEKRGSSLCYHVRSLIYTLAEWRHAGLGVAEKDYIAYPKPNGYRSLHTTLVHSLSDVPLEVQIRTRQMHEVAEFGMSAHWAYKGEQRGGPDVEETRGRRVAWLASIAESDRRRGIDAGQFVQDVLREELGKRCYVFMRNGKILNLSRGCTAIDAAFKISSEVGLHMCFPIVNGAQVQPSYTLQNGDHINIVTSPDTSPQWQWLDHAWLRSTQNKLIAHLRTRLQNNENMNGMRDFAGMMATTAAGMAAAQTILDVTSVRADVPFVSL